MGPAIPTASSPSTPTSPTVSPTPTTINKTYQAIDGATVRVAADRGLLADLPTGLSLPVTHATTSNGGQIQVAADGSFQYTPAPGFRGDDTTTITRNQYTLTPTFQVQQRAIFVKNDAPSGGNGTQAAPFRTLAEGNNTANQPGDILFLYAGDQTATGQSDELVLNTERLRLVGEAQGLATAEGLIVAPGPRPLTSGPIRVTADNVTLEGFELRNPPVLTPLVVDQVEHFTLRSMTLVASASSRFSQ